MDVPPDARLIFRYVGFNEREVAVNGQAIVNVAMTRDVRNLGDVVVVGYGTQKRKDLTGSIATLGAAAYKDQPVVNVTSALQGRVAGVAITNNSGAPGGEVKIRIRGANSVNASNNPLFVVDGIALTSIDLRDINVNDIESMEVLKDASATAVYGSRGANGVVIITTRTGKAGVTKVDYNGFVSFNKPMKQYDLLDAVKYAEMVNLRAGSPVFPDPAGFAGKTTDWQHLIFNEAVTHSHQLSLSGGTEKARYFVSGFYLNGNGLLDNSSQKKFGLRTNLNMKVNEKLSVGLNLFASRTHSRNNGDMGYKGNPVTAALTWAPTEPVYDDAAGKIYNRNGISPIWTNPYLTIREANSQNFNNVLIANGRIHYAFTDWLSLTVNAGLDASISRGAFLRNNFLTPGNMGAGQGSSENHTFQNSNVLTFQKAFNKHALTVTALAENTSSVWSGFNATGAGLTSATNGYHNLALNASQSISSNYGNSALLSYMGRVSYVFDDKYLFTASVRRDGSSKFQGKNKWGTFPSFSAAWRLSETSFVKDLNIFSNLKIRAGWGKTGNQGIAAYSTLGALTPALYSYGGSTGFQSYTLGSPQTPDVKWETTSQTDVGIDIGLFNGRMNITADYYNKNTKDLLLFTRINHYDGGGSFLKNVGKVNNKGVELSIDATPVETGDFMWTTGLNVSFNRNKVVNLGKDSIIFRNHIGGGLITTSIQAIKVGEPLGAFYLIPWEGIFQADHTATGNKAGDNKYQDVSGNNSIGFEDRVIAGNATPRVQWGFNNNLKYKNFDLNVFIQGSHGNSIFNATYAATAVPSSDVAYPTLAATANYWTPQNTTAVWADPTSKTSRNYIESTQFLQDASYIRLRNISLSYQFPKSMLRSFGPAKFTVSAQNYFTITKYKGYDPEATSTSASSDADAGIDLGAYPSPKTITLGLNITF